MIIFTKAVLHREEVVHNWWHHVFTTIYGTSICLRYTYLEAIHNSPEDLKTYLCLPTSLSCFDPYHIEVQNSFLHSSLVNEVNKLLITCWFINTTVWQPRVHHQQALNVNFTYKCLFLLNMKRTHS